MKRFAARCERTEHPLGETLPARPCLAGLNDGRDVDMAGAEVHVTLPNFRTLIEPNPNGHPHLLHLCEDREFCYRQAVYNGDPESNLRAALAFQHDVIQYVIPNFRPDIIHCHDWMTGLIPAAARSMGIPSIFTLHNLHDVCTTLSHIEDRGIDSAAFFLMPSSFEPCGLSQMIVLRYGSLPIVHATGGPRDTISQPDPAEGSGNGFHFEMHNPEGLRWFIDRAMDFYALPAKVRHRNLQRIMPGADAGFQPATMTSRHRELYQSVCPATWTSTNNP